MTIQDEILQLKREKDAVILAHYYVNPEIQAVADYVGDSFYLSKTAAGLTNDTMVFCGVSFMGESGKLLNPNKTVLMPDASADCPMAHMVTKETIDAAREEYPDLAVVCYINSTAQIKSWSDVCVTSANAVDVVKALPNKNILFIPDKNLAHWVASFVPDKHFVYNDGCCPIHEEMSAAELKAQMKIHPHAKVLVHPECNESVLALAHYIGSTTGIINFVTNSTDTEFIIGTEIGVRYELEQKNPKKQFYFTETVPICTDMKKITLERILYVLKTGENAVTIPNELQAPAGNTLKRMLDLAK